MEDWKDVNGYEGLYQVSSLGNVKSMTRRVAFRNGDRLVKERMLRSGLVSGYRNITLAKDGKTETITVHRLMMLSFFPRPKADLQVNHINGVKDDNRLENLEWVTPARNTNHSIEIGLRDNRGEANVKAKLQQEDVLEIRRLIAGGTPLKLIASKYEVETPCIWKIQHRKTWQHI